MSRTGDVVSVGDFDRFFDDFLNRRWPRFSSWSFPDLSTSGFEAGFPKMDILDRENEVEVQAALPGVKRENLEVTIRNQAITIRATTQEEKKEGQEEGKYYRREISRGECQRTVALPDYVDEDNAKAAFADGILKITLPKTEKGKRKTIEIT